MKKKNVLMMALSLALVAVIAVGGTLAYLSATTGPVTNTFTAGSGISMELYESVVVVGSDGGYVISGTSTTDANSYSDLLSNVANAKNPTVELTNVPTGGVKVYVQISGANGSTDYQVALGLDSAHWQKVSEATGNDGIYVYSTDTTDKTATVVAAEEVLEPVFNTVTFTFDQDGSSAPDFEKIVVKAFAIQAAATDAEALTAAEEAFA